MNNMHASNSQYWDATAPKWKQLRNRDELWRRIQKKPAFAFDGQALEIIRAFAGELAGKDVGVIGSGDNYAAFALSTLGACVTSIDISEQQLQVAAERADALGLNIRFLKADAADLGLIGDTSFDLVCSTNGFFVWIADRDAVFREICRVLRPGGYYIFYDVHPFQRPWKNQVSPIEMEKPYFETGPFRSKDEAGERYEFNWTLADLLNPLADSGLVLRKVVESPATDARFWEGHSYLPGTDSGLLDWKQNPRTGLPVWLTIAAEKPKGI